MKRVEVYPEKLQPFCKQLNKWGVRVEACQLPDSEKPLGKTYIKGIGYDYNFGYVVFEDPETSYMHSIDFEKPDDLSSFLTLEELLEKSKLYCIFCGNEIYHKERMYCTYCDEFL